MSVFHPSCCQFFYHVTLDKEWPKAEILFAKVPTCLPVVLNRDEVGPFFAATFIP